MVTGGGWPELGFKTGPTAGQDALPSQGALSHCVHTFGWDSVDAPVHPMCTALGWGRELESPEETHTDMGRVGQLHTHSGPGWQSVIFLHQSYHHTMLLEDPIRTADP